MNAPRQHDGDNRIVDRRRKNIFQTHVHRRFVIHAEQHVDFAAAHVANQRRIVFGYNVGHFKILLGCVVFDNRLKNAAEAVAVRRIGIVSERRIVQKRRHFKFFLYTVLFLLKLHHLRRCRFGQQDNRQKKGNQYL